MDDLTAYFDKVLQQYPDYIPAAIGSRGIFQLGMPDAKGHNDIRLAPIMSYSFTGGIPFSVALSKDGKKVIGAATIGDSDSEFADFPAPFNSHDAIYGHFGTRVQFRKYNNANPLSSEAETDLDLSKEASHADTTISGIADLGKICSVLILGRIMSRSFLGVRLNAICSRHQSEPRSGPITAWSFRSHPGIRIVR
jgi:hypothetical protein